MRQQRLKACSYHCTPSASLSPHPPPPHLTTLFDMHGLFADGSRQGGVREGLQVGEPAALLLGAP